MTGYSITASVKANSMKIQIASDLHLELETGSSPYPESVFKPDPGRDILVLAGDITDGNRWFGMSFIELELLISPIILVPGNHEYYHSNKETVNKFWRNFADERPDFHYLDNDLLQWGGLSWYGACLCSDFWGENPFKFARAINDFKLVAGWDVFKHKEEYQATVRKLAELEGQLDVVITHFPPSLGALDLNTYEDDPMNPYFINDNAALVEFVKPRLWISGHTHSPFDYREGSTHVVGNPRGYPGTRPRPGYDPMRTVTLDV